jgi:hypothetical protein
VLDGIVGYADGGGIVTVNWGGRWWTVVGDLILVKIRPLLG